MIISFVLVLLREKNISLPCTKLNNYRNIMSQPCILSELSYHHLRGYPVPLARGSNIFFIITKKEVEITHFKSRDNNYSKKILT